MNISSNLRPFNTESQILRRREAWGELLSEYRWDCFATLTYKHARKRHETLEKHFRYWLKDWITLTAVRCGLAHVKKGSGYLESMRGWLANQQRKGRELPVWVFAAEPHKSGRLHSHAIIRFPDSLRDQMNYREGWSTWTNGNKGCFGRSKIEKPKCQDDVRNYVTKYVAKEEHAIRISETFDRSTLLNVRKRSA